MLISPSLSYVLVSVSGSVGHSGSMPAHKLFISKDSIYWTVAPISIHDVIWRCIWMEGARMYGISDTGAIAISKGPMTKSMMELNGLLQVGLSFFTSGNDSPSVQRFEKEDYERVLGELVVSRPDLVIFELPSATERIKFQ